MILVRIQVAKIENMSSLEAILRSVPVKGGQPGWNYVERVIEALEGTERPKGDWHLEAGLAHCP